MSKSENKNKVTKRNQKIEENVVNAFFVERRRERAKYVLGLEDKRIDFLNRMDDLLFIPQYLYLIEQLEKIKS